MRQNLGTRVFPLPAMLQPRNLALHPLCTAGMDYSLPEYELSAAIEAALCGRAGREGKGLRARATSESPARTDRFVRLSVPSIKRHSFVAGRRSIPPVAGTAAAP